MRQPTRSTRFARWLIVLAIVAAFVPSPALAGSDTSAGSKAETYASVGFDVVLMRPLGAFAVLVGSAAFLPVALLAAPGGRESIDDALDLFVITPYRQTFERPLGEF